MPTTAIAAIIAIVHPNRGKLSWITSVCCVGVGELTGASETVA